MEEEEYPAWTRYFDENEQAYYWYNEATQESTWDDPYEGQVEYEVEYVYENEDGEEVEVAEGDIQEVAEEEGGEYEYVYEEEEVIEYVDDEGNPVPEAEAATEFTLAKGEIPEAQPSAKPNEASRDGTPLSPFGVHPALTAVRSRYTKNAAFMGRLYATARALGVCKEDSCTMTINTREGDFCFK